MHESLDFSFVKVQHILQHLPVMLGEQFQVNLTEVLLKVGSLQQGASEVGLFDRVPENGDFVLKQRLHPFHELLAEDIVGCKAFDVREEPAVRLEHLFDLRVVGKRAMEPSQLNHRLLGCL